MLAKNSQNSHGTWSHSIATLIDPLCTSFNDGKTLYTPRVAVWLQMTSLVHTTPGMSSNNFEIHVKNECAFY